jgi:hypothetical protein
MLLTSFNFLSSVLYNLVKIGRMLSQSWGLGCLDSVVLGDATLGSRDRYGKMAGFHGLLFWYRGSRLDSSSSSRNWLKENSCCMEEGVCSPCASTSMAATAFGELDSLRRDKNERKPRRELDDGMSCYMYVAIWSGLRCILSNIDMVDKAEGHEWGASHWFRKYRANHAVLSCGAQGGRQKHGRHEERLRLQPGHDF